MEPTLTHVPVRSTEEENRNHGYFSAHGVPWYVHLVWTLFALFAILYTLRWLIPALQQEIGSPP